MFAWLAANLGTIVVALIVIAIVAAIIHKLHSDRKKGIHSCGGSCGGCGGGCPGCTSGSMSCGTCNPQKK